MTRDLQVDGFRDLRVDGFSDLRVDGFSVVGFVGEITVLVDPDFVLPWDPALFVVVWLLGGAWVVAELGFVQTKPKKVKYLQDKFCCCYFQEDILLFFFEKEDNVDLTLWFLANEVDFGITVYVIQFCVGELSTVFVLKIVVGITCLPRSANFS